MTIIYRNDFNIKEEINYKLDFSKVNYNEIEYNPIGMFIPIDDEGLQNVVYDLAEDIAKCNDWCYPDNEKTKMKLFVPISFNSAEFDPAFQIEIQPPKWKLEDVDGTYSF